WSEKLNRFYTGTTNDVLKRLEQHNSASYDDSFTSKGIPWMLFLVIDCKSSKQAYAVEKHIKQMKSSIYIRNLKLYPEMIAKLLAKYI
ncbi:MAG: GIY-YIG nuclease family protein, partial [Chitinophagaceae bacterium]|nr:GIY-YIG nuclease family protein [Chitinophagaceae bacterium]